jgi:Xaa-Pro dipeptidase
MNELVKPFSAQEYRDRLHRLHQRMADEAIDLLYLSSPESMCYLHGYTARWYRAQSTTAWPPLAGTAVHVDHGHFIHFDSRGEDVLLKRTSIAQDKRYFPADESLDSGLPFIMRELKAEGWLGGTVGMEFSSHVPNRVVSEAFEQAFLHNGCKAVVDATKPIRAVRRIKSAQEIEYVEKAAPICDAAHRTIAEMLRPGVTELELYGEMARVMACAGGETSAIVSLVSSGPYTAGHGLPTRRMIEPGDHVMADLSGVFNRYHASIERGFFLGEPPRELVERYEKAGKAFDVLSEAARPGAQIAEVNRLMREYYKSEGIWDVPDKRWVGGYELGISFYPDWVGEFVFQVDQESPEGVFEEGMVTNFESITGPYLIDTFVYERDGARRLSKLTPELIVLDA